MKLHHLLLAGTTLSVIGGAFGYHHLATEKNEPASATPARREAKIRSTPAQLRADAIDTSQPSTATSETATQPAQRMSKAALAGFLDQVIADAIQRGTLDPDRLSPQQLALLPEKFQKKHDDAPQLTDEEIAHVEQQIALGDDAPPDPPPPFPCPDPNHLPDNYNNDYNKMILRERGCKL